MPASSSMAPSSEGISVCRESKSRCRQCFNTPLSNRHSANRLSPISKPTRPVCCRSLCNQGRRNARNLVLFTCQNHCRNTRVTLRGTTKSGFAVVRKALSLPSPNGADSAKSLVQIILNGSFTAHWQLATPQSSSVL